MSLPIVNWNDLNALERKRVLKRPAIEESELLSTQVKNIISRVREKGDAALFELTRNFDGVDIPTLTVEQELVEQAKRNISPDRLGAIETAYAQIKRFHQAQQFQGVNVETAPGIQCELKNEAIESVGLYIPAGSAPLPSTVLMLGVPAQLVNCQRKVLVCPPNKEGKLADEVLVAASLCGIDEIYRIGGAQACAALAFGTQSIQPVNKIFGPGNRYVTEAKKQLAQQVTGFAIDMPAGPSEVLVIADAFANPQFVAADLLSQAEHGADSQVVLISDNRQFLNTVELEMKKQLKALSRAEIAEKALNQSRLILAKDMAQAAEISNLYGPEHLILQTEDDENLLTTVRNAGSIFVGAYSPESAGDYASGTNHVLPTYGYSKVVSSLSLADFSRRYTVQRLTREGLQGIAACITELADAEGLDAHKRAVTIRLENS